jgi:hypothetical protein
MIGWPVFRENPKLARLGPNGPAIIEKFLSNNA